MPRHFEVGEIAMVNSNAVQGKYVGRTCTVIESLRERRVTTPDGVTRICACYVVQFEDGAIATACPRSLVKHFEPGSWKALRDIWQPKWERRM